MLVGKPLTVTTAIEGEVKVEDVTYLSGIRNWLRFVVGETGFGTQFANPCQDGPCIHPGRIRWKCRGAQKKYI